MSPERGLLGHYTPTRLCRVSPGPALPGPSPPLPVFQPTHTEGLGERWHKVDTARHSGDAVTLDHFHIDFYAQARPFGYGEMAFV